MVKTKKKRKCNKAMAVHCKARVNFIIELLVKGYRHNEIINYIKQFSNDTTALNNIDWNISERQLERYIATAQSVISKRLLTNRDYYINRSIKRKDMLFRMALERDDVKLANNVDDSMIELLGMKKLVIESRVDFTFTDIPQSERGIELTNELLKELEIEKTNKHSS
jgi:hypothetical protein